MSRWTPCKRTEFIRKLRVLGFSEPVHGTRHAFMRFANHRQTIPSNKEFSVAQVRMLVRQVGTILERTVSEGEWESL